MFKVWEMPNVNKSTFPFYFQFFSVQLQYCAKLTDAVINICQCNKH